MSNKKLKKRLKVNTNKTSSSRKTSSVKEMLDAAFKHHEAGRLQEATDICRQILRTAPGNPDASHLQGLIAHQAGKNETAIQFISKAIESAKDQPLYHYNLGLVLYTQGQLDKAVLSFENAIRIRPGFADAYINLGNILKEQGKLEQAVHSFKRAIELTPGSPAAYYNLGNTYRDQGELEQAAQSYLKTLQLRPGFAEAHNNLGNILRGQGALEKAAASYKQAISINPLYIEAYYNLGSALHGLGKIEEAAQAYQKAININPDFAEAYNNLGLALYDLGKTEAAAQAYQKAINIKAGFAEAHYNMGTLLWNSGRLDDAERLFRKTLQFRPDFAAARKTLAMLGQHTAHDDNILAMETMFHAPGATSEQKIHLGFGLGKAYDDLGRYEESFGFILEANRLKRTTFAYDVSEDRDLFDRLKIVFSRQFLIEHAVSGCPDNTPVFILGLPRSGTSLVEQILASHPFVHGAGELAHLHRIIRQSCGRKDGTDFPECAEKFCPDDLKRLGNDYLKSIRQYSDSARHITDKMPANYIYIGLIHLLLPNAGIIHCKRDPRDTCLSIFMNDFNGVHNYAYDLRELGEYYLLYHDLMEHWHSLLPGRIHDIQYEELVADPENQIRRLLDYCGLGWDEACLSFHKTERLVRTSSASQVRRPLYASSAGRWKLYEEQLGPLLSILEK